MTQCGSGAKEEVFAGYRLAGAHATHAATEASRARDVHFLSLVVRVGGLGLEGRGCLRDTLDCLQSGDIELREASFAPDHCEVALQGTSKVRPKLLKILA